MIDEVLSPFDHVYAKSPVPPVLKIVAVPSIEPKQVVGVELSCDIISLFSDISKLSITVQPHESVTCTEYKPEGS